MNNKDLIFIEEIERVIQEARAKIDAGQTTACNQLTSLINQVNAFRSNGTLTPVQGQPLIDVANALKSNLGC